MIDTLALARVRSLRLVTLLFVAALSASCDEIGAPAFDEGEGEGEVDLARTQLPLVKGRKVTVSPWATGATDPGTPQTIDLTNSSDQMHPVLIRIRQQCRRDIFAGRKAALTPNYNGDCDFSATAFSQCDANTTLPPGQLDGDGTGAVQSALYWNCMGNYALSIAEATSTYYIGTTGQPGSTAGYGAISTKRWKVGTDYPGNAILYTVNPSSSSDRASWALLATDLFREAVEAATIVAQHPNCSEAALTTNCKSTETGLQVPTNFMNPIVAQIPEALANSVEAAEKATKYLHASAQAKRATVSDGRISREILWRDSYDSLLRAASAYVAIPDALFNASDSNGNITTKGLYPIVTHISINDGDRRAEELIRRHKLDPSRNVTNVANDLLASLKVELPGALTAWSPTAGLGYLASVGIEQADFERAVVRLRQEAEVLGRPILAYTDANGVRHASGVEKLNAPVNPAYLYAITEGRSYSGRGEFDLADSAVAIDYARAGIFHAMEYFLEKSKEILARTGAFSARNRSFIDSAQAYAKHQVQGHIAVRSCDTACPSEAELGPGIDRIWVRIATTEDSPLTSAEQIDARRAWLVDTYDIWLGEEGLDCALTGQDRSGQGCLPGEHKFVESIIAAVGGYGSFDLNRAYGPLHDGVTVNPYVKDGAAVSPRIYITRVVTAPDGTTRNELVAGLTLTAPATGWGTFRMPISSGLSEALQNTLAVDPLKADETAQLCGKGGLARNQKVGLEDELLQAQGVNGSNTVEESWAYYLGLAKQAGEEADMIGSELVDRGLEMDMIAEDARAELEDQCGGTINIASIRAGVCASPYNCNLKKYLEDPSNATNESLQQLKQCLGIEKPVDAVLGSNAVCAWQMEGYAPCACPDPEQGTTQALAYSVCPGRGLVDQDFALGRVPTRMCPAVVPRGTLPLEKPDGTPGKYGSCEAIFPAPDPWAQALITSRIGPSADNLLFPKGVNFKIFNKKLGLIPQMRKSLAPPENACGALAALRGGESLEPAARKAAEAVMYWSRKNLKETALRLGVERNDLNFAAVTRDGMGWLGTGRSSPSTDPNPWLAKQAFPCSQMPNVKCPAGSTSLLCSLDCKPSGTDVEMADGRHVVGERLARAVEVLRVVTGAGLKGVEIATYPRFRPRETIFDLVDYEPLAIKPGSTRIHAVGSHALSKTGISFAHFAACDLQTQLGGGIAGYPECRDRLQGLDDSNWEFWKDTRSEIEYDAYSLSTTHKIVDNSVDKGGDKDSATLVCRSAHDTTRHPFPDYAGRDWLPPACTSTTSAASPAGDHDIAWLWFMDAGDILTWPLASDVLLASYWRDHHETKVAFGVGLGARAVGRLVPRPNDQLEFAHHSRLIERVWPALNNYTSSELIDGLELACLAENPPPDTLKSCEDPGLLESARLKGVDDLARVRGIINCRAEQISKATASLTLSDVPKSLVQQVSGGGVAGIYPAFGGQYAVTVNELYGALVRISTHMIDLSEQTRAAGNALDLMRLNLEAAKYKRQIEVENAAKELGALRDQCSMATASAAASAAASMLDASSWGLAVSSFGTGNAAHAVRASAAMANAQQQCSAGRAQQAHVRTISALGGELAKTEQGIIIVQAADAMLKQQAAVERTWNGLKTAYGDAQAALAKLAAQRNAAYRAAAKMLMLDGDGAGHDYASNTAMRARLNTLRVKYERARDYAVRMTYLARRAVEQKIGMDLSTLEQDVGWVPAPKKWADTICSLEGIDYKKISNARAQDGQEDATGKPYDYADQYVGDYVTRLQEFMTAYVNNYVSHDGDDVALVSVRDELLGLRTRNCDVYGQNELLQTAEAKEVAAFGAGEQEQRDFVATGVWETTCNASGLCVAPAGASTDDDPLVHYGRDAMGNPAPAKTTDSAANELAADAPDRIAATDMVDFGALGDVVKAVKLRTEVETVSGGVGDPTAPQQPPANGMAYWYRADACDPASATSACADLSGNGQHTGPVVGERPSSIINSGIGGLPTLSVSSGSAIYRSGPLPAYPEYTLTAVVRPSTVSAYLWYNDAPRSQLLLYPHAWFFGSAYSLGTHGKAPPIAAPQVGDIVTVRVQGTMTDMFVNGVLRSRVLGAGTPSDLGARLVYVGGVDSTAPTPNGSWQFAETMAYRRGLSDAELASLHSYLAGRYRIDTRKPVTWFSADAIQEMRVAADGSSPTSGHRYLDGLVRDLATGYRFGTWPSQVEASPPAEWESRQFVPFAGGTQALRFGASDGFHTARINETNVSGQPAAELANGEFAATLVLSAENGSNHRVLTLATMALGPSSQQLGSLNLKINCALGRVEIVDTERNTTRVTADRSVSCGSPVVVTLRGSERNATTDTFINGELALSDPSWRRIASQPVVGAAGGEYFVGALADFRFHMQELPDADIIALHAQLGTKYGIPTAGADDGSGAPTTVDGRPVTTTPEYRQLVRLDGGTYLLSWYEQLRASGDAIEPYLTPFVRSATGTTVPVVSGVAAGSPYQAGDDRWLASGWARHWATFSAAGEVYVGWQVPPSTGDLVDGVLFAAPQLEEVEGADLMSVGPSQFWPTDDDGLSPFGTCEDRGGVQMRKDVWSEGCEVYCPAGLGNDCASTVTDPDLLPKRCFHELKFHISQDEIEKGKLIPQGGFAAGNFNYRWEQIGVNVVGTAIKNCENSELPSACYANNFLQYSLRHDGPFTVRNYLGRDYEAPIYAGRIQQSKALMAERYLTNPLSSADRSLLTDFWDYEFVGRPLEGNYTLRIYGTEEDGLDWDKVEDIQLLMHYRYWTRLN